MRQASWEDMFKGADEKEIKPGPFSLIGRFFSWEDLVTLAIVLIGFLTVVGSINGADWVSLMPSLFPIAFLGLLAGLLLAKSGIGEILGHLLGLVIGTVGVLYYSTSKLDGSIFTRVNDLADRMWIWGRAVYEGGISTDNLPFVVLVVAVTYLTAYVAAWSLFRWYNAWLALIPGGLALLTNISYLPGHHSTPLLIYLFCAILLLARANLLRHTREWQREQAGYPDFISLHVLNVTVWVAVALLAIAWIMPVGGGSGALLGLWRTVTAPVARPLADLSRVFAAVDSKKGVAVHSFGSIFPLQGAITLGSSPIMSVTTSEPLFLRAQSYDEYVSQGWKIGSASRITRGDWPAMEAMQSVQEAQAQLRRPVAADITLSKDSNVVLTAGQPLDASIDTKIVSGQNQADITSIRPASPLKAGDQYHVDSTVSNASIERLEAASTDYPDWIGPYLQLPSSLPNEIGAKAREVTSGSTTPYDSAVKIEQYLRTFAIDTKIPPAGPKQDSVDYFLFDVQRGYFDYHASAMVVMLRTLGIPARIAVGYVLRPQDRSPNTNTYAITEANSFAWPEVYFPGLGWVDFNPTPNEPRVARTGTDSLTTSGDDAFAFGDELPLSPDELPSSSAAPAIDALVQKNESHFLSHALLGVVGAFLAVSLVAGGIFQFGWQRGMRGLDYPAQIWEKTLRLSRWAHIRTLPQQTPREMIQRLHRELPEIDDLDYLSESYVRGRYGHKQLTSEEKERLTSVWKQVRNRLFSRVLRWKK
jgi:hypothetical protein